MEDQNVPTERSRQFPRPYRLFEALAKRPATTNLTITIQVFDEGWNFAFIESIRDGFYIGQGVGPTDALYQNVYGQSEPRDD